MYTNNTIISEVEKNQKLIRIQDVLIYVDNDNCEKFIVTDLFKGGFMACDSEGNEDLYFFNELQLGWYFTEKTKKQNTELYHLRYVD